MAPSLRPRTDAVRVSVRETDFPLDVTVPTEVIVQTIGSVLVTIVPEYVAVPCNVG